MHGARRIAWCGMNTQLHPIMSAALASAVDVAALKAENAALKEELQIAVGECCNQYYDDGHYARVQRLYGIDLDMLKVLGNAL